MCLDVKGQVASIIFAGLWIRGPMYDCMNVGGGTMEWQREVKPVDGRPADRHFNFIIIVMIITQHKYIHNLQQKYIIRNDQNNRE